MTNWSTVEVIFIVGLIFLSSYTCKPCLICEKGEKCQIAMVNFEVPGYLKIHLQVCCILYLFFLHCVGLHAPIDFGIEAIAMVQML